MFNSFFYELKRAQVPVSLREYLTLLEAVEAGLANYAIEDFYYLSRSALVKDERHIDRFDQVFGHVFKGLEYLSDIFKDVFGEELPEEWLRQMAELHLSEEERAEIEARGGWDKLMEELKQRLEEQKGRHQGGNKWVGTAGKSPFGAYGYNPEGVRVGQEEGREGRAVKVWDKREFRNYDDNLELGTRNIKVALRKLRRFAREGAASELDLSDTIRSTARNGGYLDLKMVPERHNAVKVLLFLDVGGSMDPHVKVCEELFSAARTEFKHLEYFYFHNFIYESVWKNNIRRFNERTSTLDLMHKYAHDYKVVFVGDASMSPYEIMQPGGSVEHWNEESGELWMRRLRETYEKCIWINPVPEDEWEYTQSIAITRQLMEGKMYPLTLRGLEDGMSFLSK